MTDQKLTARERDIVMLLAQGHGDLSAAASLSISPRTVRFHLDNARTKLKALTRCQLVAIAITTGEIAFSNDVV